MTGPEVIDGYLAELAAQLPAHIVAELADGLYDSYTAHSRGGFGDDDAARAAVAEFGDSATVVSAFVTASPARRSSRQLLLSGPLVGGAWGAVLLARQAWTWPLGIGPRAVFGAAVIAAVALLAAGAVAGRYRRAGRAVLGGCVLVLGVDVTMLAYVAATGMLREWPVPLAVALSAARIAFVLGRLPRLRSVW